MTGIFKYKNTTAATIMAGCIFILSGCVHSSEPRFKNAGVHQTQSATLNSEIHSPAATEPAESLTHTDQNQRADSEAALRQNNIARNNALLDTIKKQNYTQYNNDFYFKVLKQGNRISTSSMTNKTVTLTLNETLTDGTVTADYNKSQPLVAPYYQLPSPLNLFITKTGEHGKLKIYARPEVAYGKSGIPGKIPPESMSITTIEVLSIK